MSSSSSSWFEFPTFAQQHRDKTSRARRLGDFAHGGVREGAGRPRKHEDPRAAKIAYSRAYYQKQKQKMQQAKNEISALREDLTDLKTINKNLIRKVEALDDERWTSARFAANEIIHLREEVERREETEEALVNAGREKDAEIEQLRLQLEQREPAPVAQTSTPTADDATKLEVEKLRDELARSKRAKKAKEDQLINAQKEVGELRLKLYQLENSEDDVDPFDETLMTPPERKLHDDRQNLTIAQNLQLYPQHRPRKLVQRFKPTPIKKKQKR